MRAELLVCRRCIYPCSRAQNGVASIAGKDYLFKKATVVLDCVE